MRAKDVAHHTHNYYMKGITDHDSMSHIALRRPRARARVSVDTRAHTHNSRSWHARTREKRDAGSLMQCDQHMHMQFTPPTTGGSVRVSHISSNPNGHTRAPTDVVSAKRPSWGGAREGERRRGWVGINHR
jgi:hypothetical protein